MTVGWLAADAGIAKGAWTVDDDGRGAFELAYAARSARACLIGVQVRASQAAQGCTLGIGMFTLDPMGKAVVPLQLDCVDKDRHHGRRFRCERNFV